MGQINATIDIGTNTILLLIAEWKDGKINVLRDEARIARLGEGLYAFPLFLFQAQERAIAILRDYAKICKEAGVEKIVAVGTAACRKARNANAFIERVQQELGFTIAVIPGEKEAQLSYLSAVSDFPQYENPVVMDIGGGSTEIISKDNKVSLDLGSVVLTERIIKNDPPTEDEIMELEAAIYEAVDSLQTPSTSSATFIGLAGTVTTLSAIKQKLVTWDGTRVQGSRLTWQDLKEMVELFQKTSLEEKKKIPGMVAGREDTILAGTMIAQAVMEKLNVEEMIVSDRGIRFGVFYEKFGATRF